MKRKIIEQNLENNELSKNNFDCENAKSRFLRIAFGILFLLLAFISLLAIYFSDYFLFLSSFKEFIFRIFGKCNLLLPICLAIIGTSILSEEEYKFLNPKNFGLFFIVIAVCGFVHHLDIEPHFELYPNLLADGGGFIGGIVVLPLHKFFDATTTLAVLIIIFVIGIFLMIPYFDFVSYLFYPFILLKRLIAKKIKEKRSKNVSDGNAKFIEDDINENINDYVKEKNHMDIPQKKNENHSTIKYLSSKNITLSARDIIFGRKKDKYNVSEKIQDEKKNNTTTDNLVRKLYDRKEFTKFSDGIRKEGTLKRIIRKGYSDNVYSELKEKKSIEIPDWQEKRTMVNSFENTYNSVQNNINAEDDTKSNNIIPLCRNTGNENSEKLIIKHYRENSVDDIQHNMNDNSDNVSDTSTKPIIKRRIFYKYPNVDLLDKPHHINSAVYEKDIRKQCEILEQTLDDFKVLANVTGATRGPSITRFEVEPAPGVKVSSVINLADDIALKLAASGVRIEAPIPGKAAIGIEVPNLQNDSVFLKEIVADKIVKSHSSPLCIGLGKDISGNVITIDLTKMPHLLVAGSTGSGKSVCINSIIMSILFKAHPDEVKFILIDPKVVELSNYNGIPHLLTPVVTDMKQAASALHWAVKEMEKRYTLFAKSHVKEINSYNLSASQKLPFIVVIIDELSDLMMVARIDVEDAILRLAQKARAAGIHLILATQRPSVDVITGIIKANIPSRIAFAVSSQTDSRTILDIGGAEKLVGKGDMLYYPIGVNKPLRVQGAFVSDNELNGVVDFIVNQSIPTNYTDGVTSEKLNSNNNETMLESESSNVGDELFKDALHLVLDMGQASSSMLQRRFRIGYTRAARLVDTMEELGIIGLAIGSKPREVIMSREEIENKFLNE